MLACVTWIAGLVTEGRSGWMRQAALTMFVGCMFNCAQGQSKQSLTDASPTVTVDAALDSGPPDACVSKVEQCNGLDDDCDGTIDNGFAGVGDDCAVGVGACRVEGSIVCGPDSSSPLCNAQIATASAETCDSIDNDCDGMVDEGFGVGLMCDGTDSDVCKEGVTACVGGVAVCNDATADTVELCDGTDNDCDGTIDEGFMLGSQCDGGDSDACREGVIVCDGAGGAKCNDASGSTTESCNDFDDDCDGTVDDGYLVGQACSVGVGACLRTGQQVCTTSGTGTQCSVAAGTPGREVCSDGTDQDCNGSDVSCPVNDAPSAAIDISAGGTFSVDLSAARDDQNELMGDCGEPGGRDVFYKFTLSQAEVVYADTFGSDFDSVIRIYAGSCTSVGALQTCGDDACTSVQSQAAIQLAPGAYCLVVDQFKDATIKGSSILTFVRGGRTGAVIPTVTGSQTATTVGRNNVQTSTGCQANVSGPDAAYYFTTCPAANLTVSADVCTATSFDTIISMRRGNARATEDACSDDSCGLLSNLPDVAVTGSGLHWFIVDGYNGASGAFTLNYSFN
jgi:hypothetical protein